MKFGFAGWPPALKGAKVAKDGENRGFDICYFGDNTCFAADPFGELRDAARATSTITLATGVTNTVTKHPSVIATAMASVQLISGGRAVCGLGKGDSAMAVIGRGPQRHDEFVEKTRQLRAYLRKEPIEVEGWSSYLSWLDDFPHYRPVPLEVMASGPRTLRAATAFADRITLAISCDPERIAWAMGIIDEGLAEHGRSRSDIEVGVFAKFAIADDPDSAAELLRGRVKGVAHMASFKGHDLSYQPEILQQATKALRDGYDYNHHNINENNPLGMLVTPEFAAWFGIGGSVSQVVDRIRALERSGVSYVFTNRLPLEEWNAFSGEVMPQCR